MPGDPVSVNWTAHALAKAQQLGYARGDVESKLLGRHGERRRNQGEADWRLSAAQLVILYNHPDGDGPLAARIVTIWRRR